MVACGSDSSETQKKGFQQLTETDRSYTIDDLVAVGFKRSKTFDVEGLPEAVSAHYGFWGPDPYSRMEFEARFYGSHADAVAFGAPMAEALGGRLPDG